MLHSNKNLFPGFPSLLTPKRFGDTYSMEKMWEHHQWNGYLEPPQTGFLLHALVSSLSKASGIPQNPECKKMNTRIRDPDRCFQGPQMTPVYTQGDTKPWFQCKDKPKLPQDMLYDMMLNSGEIKCFFSFFVMYRY